MYPLHIVNNTVSLKYMHKTTYALGLSDKSIWLQKICFALLDKLGCRYNYPMEAKLDIITMHDKDIHNLSECVRESINSYIYLYNTLPKRIIIGSRTFSKFYSTQSRHYANVTFLLYGMKITVTPMIEGYVLIPPEAE